MRRSKKGFTLIELLAVIVILAVIALIAVPIVLNIIEKARKGAVKTSALNYMNAVETYIVASKLDKDALELKANNSYNCTKETLIDGKNYLAINDLVEIKGYRPTGSKDKITIDQNNRVTAGEITINGYTVEIKDKEIASIVKGSKIEVENIALNYSEQTMEKGSTFQLKPLFTPKDASDQRVTYASSNESIVTVNDEGIVTAKNNGTAKVIVTSKDNTSKKAECNITVVTSATGVTIEPTSKEINIGSTLQLTGTIQPGDVTTNALTWTSSNSSVAHVDENGLVTGMSKGTATITAKTVNGKTATSTITVKEIEATSVSLNKTSATIDKGNTLQLTAAISPSNTTNKSLTWESSNTSVATVSDSGLVTGKAAGSATITVKTSNNKTATCTITVTVPVESVSISSSSNEVYVGETLQLSATVSPSNATNKSVTWTSSNTSVATVSSSGLVTGKAAGTATITVKTSNNKTATKNITVKTGADIMILKEDGTDIGSTYTVWNTDRIQLKTNAPSGALVTWTSSDESKATVSSTGLVVFKVAGTVGRITVTSRGKSDYVDFSRSMCFTGETLINTDKGFKQIKDIKVGDKVYSYNEKTGEVELDDVIKKMNLKTKTIYHLHVGFDNINTTENHEFYIRKSNEKDYKVITTKEIKVGDYMRTKEGKEVRISKIDIERKLKEVDVYNFTVNKNHNYFITNNKYLTHNALTCG